MDIQPYLFFDGRCDEAAEFYKQALGATVVLRVRYMDGPDKSMIPPGGAEKVMHMMMTIGGTTVFASDGQCSGSTKFDGFALSLTLKEGGEVDRYFAALSDGGQVQMPVGPTFFSPRFGMVKDRFGVLWILYVAP